MELAVENFKVESGANSNNGTKWKCIGADWLWQQLRSSEPKVTVLDCRSASDFSECHIRQAVHLSLPSIMLRRLAGGKVTISSVLKCTEARQQLAEAYGKHTFVLCGDLMSSERHPHEMLPVLHKSLVQDGCLVVCLEGGIEEFRSKYPEWCMTRESHDKVPDALPSLRICPPGESLGSRNSSAGSGRSASNRRPGSLGSRSASDSEEERPDSSLESAEIRPDFMENPPEFGSGFSLGLSVGLRLGLDSDPLPDVLPDQPDPDPGFPVEILPFLFLGNAQNSRDCDALDRHHIRYVVNVTPNLPNVFEDTGLIQYLQIPITDHWSQNLASFFPTAISFIDGARDRQEGVLVHCLAGISRSVTITVAYLMYKLSMSLNDAYDFVRRRKANISPNFNFMGQLLDFERQLNPPSPQRCTCHLTSNGEHQSGAPAAGSAAEAAAVVSAATEVVLPLTRLSIEEKEDEDDVIASSPSSTDPSMSGDSGLPSSVSLSPCSTASSDSSASSPALANSSSSNKRLRTFVCRCQASLAQCHFTTPTNL